MGALITHDQNSMLRTNLFLRAAVRSSRSFLLAKSTYNTTQHVQDHLEEGPSSSLRFFPRFPITPFSSSTALRYFSIKISNESEISYEELEQVHTGKYSLKDQTFDGEETDGWEEEEEAEPEIGDGGDGGGVVIGDLSWGPRVLDIANETLQQFTDDIKMFAFKISPRGYIYVRLDKLSEKYGCPSMEEIEQYSRLYNKRLDEVGESGEIPDDLALEVSSAGAERLLRVPDDLDRFKKMPMRVSYVEDNQKPGSQQKDGIFLFDGIESEAEQCVWKLAQVKENRDPQAKGRPFSRKQKDWRLKLPYGSLKRVTLYLEY